MSLVNINIQGGGIPAVGSVLYLANLGSPQLYNPVGNVGNQKWGMKALQADVTNQGTAWKQSIPTLLDGGTFTADVHFIPDSAGTDGTAGIEGHSFTSGLGFIFTSRQIRQWKLVFPNGTVEYFNAFILDFPIDMNVEKDLMINMTLQVVGEPILL